MDIHHWIAAILLGGIWALLVVAILLNRPPKKDV